jgi:hypothetical protein
VGGEDVDRQRSRHIGVVELGETKRRLAELAVLLLGVREPLHQAVLVDVLDAAAAFARIEEGIVGSGLASAYAAGVGVGRGGIVFSRMGGQVGRERSPR